MRSAPRWVLALAFAVAIAAGCGSGDEHGAGDPAELACDETTEAGTSIEAATTRDDAAPELELGGEPYTVALSETEPTYVRVEIAEDAAALLLLDTEDVVTALYHGDEEEELVAAGPVERCEEDIPEHFDVDFHESGTYYLELAPSAADTVWLLLLDAAGHGHDDPDH